MLGGHGIFSGISFYSHTIDENVHSDERGGYGSQTSHSPSHNPGGRGRFLCRSAASLPDENMFVTMRGVI